LKRSLRSIEGGPLKSISCPPRITFHFFPNNHCSSRPRHAPR